MPKKFPSALPWTMFEALLDRVYQLAQQPGEEHHYRFLIFAATVGYYGLPVDLTLAMKWADVGVDYFDNIEKYNDLEITWTYHTGGKRVKLTKIVNADYLKVAYKAFSLAHPEHAKSPILTENPILDYYIAPSLRSTGTRRISHQSLNQLLTSTAAKVGFNPADISTLAFRKTWVRHWYDLNGQTKKALKEIKKHFNHKTLAHTKRFIAFASENGIPPVY